MEYNMIKVEDMNGKPIAKFNFLYPVEYRIFMISELYNFVILVTGKIYVNFELKHI